MKTSANYGLKLMEGTDNVKRQDFVDNFTTIDTQMKNIENKTSLYGTTSGTNTYTTSITGVNSYYDGLKVTVKIGTTSTGASTLNINSLGAKTILDNLGNAITSGGLKAGIPYTLCYNGSNFILQGKGGGGTATADKILSGYTATVNSGQITGTMVNNSAMTSANSIGVNNDNNAYIRIPTGAYLNKASTGYPEIVTPYSMIANAVGVDASKILSGYSVLGVAGGIVNRGAVSATLNAGGSFTIPAGYHNGSGRITANSLASQNAKQFASGTITISSGTLSFKKISGSSASSRYADITFSGNFVPKYGYITEASNAYWQCCFYAYNNDTLIFNTNNKYDDLRYYASDNTNIILEAGRVRVPVQNYASVTMTYVLFG